MRNLPHVGTSVLGDINGQIRCVLNLRIILCAANVTSALHPPSAAHARPLSSIAVIYLFVCLTAGERVYNNIILSRWHYLRYVALIVRRQSVRITQKIKYETKNIVE